MTIIFQRVLAFCSIMLLLSSSMEASHQHVTTGRVIARDAYIGLPRMSSVTNVSIFIVRVDDAQRGTKSPRFLKVRYEDYADQRPLPADLLEGKSSWRFSLQRNRRCDQVVSEGLFAAQKSSKELPKPDTFVLVQSADQKDVPPINSTLPCFILRPGGAKPITSANISSERIDNIDPATGNLRVTVPLVATTKPSH